MEQIDTELAALIVQARSRCLNDGTVRDNFCKKDIASALVTSRDGSDREKTEAMARLRTWS
jgi:hypothetical protein